MMSRSLLIILFVGIIAFAGCRTTSDAVARDAPGGATVGSGNQPQRGGKDPSNKPDKATVDRTRSNSNGAGGGPGHPPGCH